MDVWRGFILVADIVKFSENSHATQIAMVQHLLAGLDGREVLKPRNGRDPALISRPLPGRTRPDPQPNRPRF